MIARCSCVVSCVSASNELGFFTKVHVGNFLLSFFRVYIYLLLHPLANDSTPREPWPRKSGVWFRDQDDKKLAEQRNYKLEPGAARLRPLSTGSFVACTRKLRPDVTERYMRGEFVSLTPRDVTVSDFVAF